MDPKKIIFSLFFILFSGLFIYNIMMNSGWIWDTSIAIVYLFLFYVISKKVNIGSVGLFFAYFVVLMHNLGIFGLYSKTFFSIGYDKYVHFISSFVGGIIIATILIKSSLIVDILNQKFIKKLILILGSVSIVILIGIIIEFIEFSGYFFFHTAWQGMFSPSDLLAKGPDYLYIDTIGDIFTNVLGSLLGSIYIIFWQGRDK